MPIYEYQASGPDKGCGKCGDRFEVIQRPSDKPLDHCPTCGGRVTKLISWCRAAVAECSDVHGAVERRIQAYEKEGMWSHAAELADKHSEKVRDTDLKMRAIDDYAKAGYDAKTLDKHAKSNFGDND